MQHNDFLIEIGTEELPPKSLLKLITAFHDHVKKELLTAELEFKEIKTFATPRRLALIISQLAEKQADRDVERRGPAVKAAFDADGKPSKACEGFARSCGVAVEELDRLKTEKGEWLVFRSREAGKTITELLPEIIAQSLKKLPIPKMMRWGNQDIEFIRPAHWIVMLYGNDIVPATILGKKAGRETRGHRFHAPEPITLASPDEYETTLNEAKVIASFEKRRAHIKKGVTAIAKENNVSAVIETALLDEVTGIVEWPVPLIANFEKEFLQVPSEALIAAMRDHQKYFHTVNDKKELMNHFITVSNIESQDVARVIHGNERVMRARLSDAAFFYHVDLEKEFASHLDQLKNVSYQNKLGSLFDKSSRLAQLAVYIAEQLNADTKQAERAGWLAKCDLVTDMVQEFPELQGIMGCYYAEKAGEDKEVAVALREIYHPRYSGDSLPTTRHGDILALAERIDTLVGIFGINQQPTGMKDPFKLRRAALGAVRILIEKNYHLDLEALLNYAVSLFGELENKNVITEIKKFMSDRMRSWYLEQNFGADVLNAVLARDTNDLADFHERLIAINQFRDLDDAQALAAANKRVSKLLEKESVDTKSLKIDKQLLKDAAEKNLAQALSAKKSEVDALFQNKKYTQGLKELAELRQPIDTFFDEVMVMVDEKELRNNRLALLAELRELFLNVADISLLQAQQAVAE